MDKRSGNNQPIRALLKHAAEEISESLAHAPEGSAETPYLDAIVLLCDATGFPRERLLAMMGDPIDENAVKRFDSLIASRCTGKPISYVRGTKEFFGREFVVNEHVLVPRPETEHLVEYALNLADRLGPTASYHLHDCCTGSGAIAITIAAERAGLEVTASDLSPEALTVSKRNAVRLLPTGSEVLFFASNLLSGLDLRITNGELPRPTVITANPPYLTQDEYQKLREAQWPEPEIALSAGLSGLDIITRLVSDAARLLAPGGYLITEIGAEQGPATRSLFRQAGYVEIEVVRDLARRDRICAGRTNG